MHAAPGNDLRGTISMATLFKPWSTAQPLKTSNKQSAPQRRHGPKAGDQIVDNTTRQVSHGYGPKGLTHQTMARNCITRKMMTRMPPRMPLTVKAIARVAAAKGGRNRLNGQKRPKLVKADQMSQSKLIKALRLVKKGQSRTREVA